VLVRERLTTASEGVAVVTERSGDLLAIDGLTKMYVGQLAISDVSARLDSARSLGLAGHNGSGKSTLVKVLGGYVGADRGSGHFKGSPIDLTRVGGQWRDEVHVVHQDLGLISQLTVGEQFGLVGGAAGRTSRRERRAIAAAALDRFGVRVSQKQQLGDLTRGQQALVALARVAHSWPNPNQLLVLDEVTSPLGFREVQHVFALLNQLKEAGAGILLVTHRPAELLDFCEDVLVLRDGRVVARMRAADTTQSDLVHAISGESRASRIRADAIIDEAEAEFAGAPSTPSAAGSRRPATGAPVRDDAPVTIEVSVPSGPNFSVSADWNRVVGVIGNIGSGHDAVVSLLSTVTGLGSSITIGGIRIDGGKIMKLRRAGVQLMPRDRLKLGIIPNMSATENIVLALPGRPRLLRNRGADLKQAREWFDTFDIQPRQPQRELRLFSGGNQQKAILARCIASEPSLLIVDEPTEGVDIGAKVDIITALRTWVMVEERSVIACMSDVDTAMELCDTIVVIRDYQAVGQCTVADTSRSELLRLASGA
jgi:ABC-type sugar transport system ATPase subunit